MSRDDPAPRLASACGLPASLSRPQVSLLGDVDADRARVLLDQLREAEQGDGEIVVEVTTLGGDADLARRIVLEIDLARRRRERPILFLGKTMVYSAGMTIMSAFPRSDRYLAAGTDLLIHGRQFRRTVEISGPLRASLHQIEALGALARNGLAQEERDFRRLIRGSDIGFEELCRRAADNWYLSAEEALQRRLVGGILGGIRPALRPLPRGH
jgi:hypothetical protein